MQVFLVRHAIAHERSRSRWPDDALRPLTPEGKRRFRKAARGLALFLPRSVLLTSPHVRARQTAEILATAIGRRAKPIECPALVPGEPADQAFELLRTRQEESVILVGHEPNLSVFLSTALATGRGRLRCEFRKGGAACVEFAGKIEPGRAALKWFLPPRVLRGLR